MADLVEIEDARRLVLATCTPPATEPVELGRALGRVLAREVATAEPISGEGNLAAGERVAVELLAAT